MLVTYLCKSLLVLGLSGYMPKDVHVNELYRARLPFGSVQYPTWRCEHAAFGGTIYAQKAESLRQKASALKCVDAILGEWK